MSEPREIYLTIPLMVFVTVLAITLCWPAWLFYVAFFAVVILGPWIDG